MTTFCAGLASDCGSALTICLTTSCHSSYLCSPRTASSAHSMRTDPIPARRTHLAGMVAFGLQARFIVLAIMIAVATAVATPHSDEGQTLLVRVEAPESDVLKAVEQVTQDQIIHGTYSYEKERILYGAHSADAAQVFGVWKGQGKAFYKVANKVLSPRFFKDSEDIGTISVRYVVQEAGPDAASVQIDAIFVDARNVRHPSLGNVESSEYAADSATP